MSIIINIIFTIADKAMQAHITLETSVMFMLFNHPNNKGNKNYCIWFKDEKNEAQII